MNSQLLNIINISENITKFSKETEVPSIYFELLVYDTTLFNCCKASHKFIINILLYSYIRFLLLATFLGPSKKGILIFISLYLAWVLVSEGWQQVSELFDVRTFTAIITAFYWVNFPHIILLYIYFLFKKYVLAVKVFKLLFFNLCLLFFPTKNIRTLS